MLSVIEGSSPAPNASNVTNGDTARGLAAARRRVGKTSAAKWSRVVATRDPVETLRRAMHRPPISRAYFKLCEMHPLLPTCAERALLLCEAPGGFYQAVSRLYPSSRRVATSWEAGLPFHELAKGDVLRALPHGGDIRYPQTADEIERRLGPNSMDLVTADGGTFYEELDTVEQSSFRLLVAQLIVVLRLNRQSGSCILKVFEGSTQPTRDVVAILRGLYANVHLYKPRTSKAANSERYVIGRDMLSQERSQQMAEELATKVMTKQNVLSLLENADSGVDNAFDALAKAQTNELQRLLDAAGGDAAATAALKDLRAKDIQWIRTHVPCLA